MTMLAGQRYRNRDISLFVAAFIGVIFLALKADVTGDVAGDRELWMFAGAFMALCGVISLNRYQITRKFAPPPMTHIQVLFHNDVKIYQ